MDFAALIPRYITATQRPVSRTHAAAGCARLSPRTGTSFHAHSGPEQPVRHVILNSIVSTASAAATGVSSTSNAVNAQPSKEKRRQGGTADDVCETFGRLNQKRADPY